MSEAKYVSTKPLEEFSVNKKRKSDLISRLSELRSQYNCFNESERDVYHTLSEAIEALQQKTGKWIFVHPIQEDDSGGFLCSCCKYGEYKQSNYCPHCGARMEREEE